MLEKAKIWVTVASCKRSRTEGSLMAYSLPPVALPLVAMQQQLKKMISITLGNRKELVPPPTCNQPNGFNATLPQQVATAAITSMAANQPTVASMSDIFSQRVAATMWMYAELQSNDTGYKRLTDVQKGALMGFCNETSWKDVPPCGKISRPQKQTQTCTIFLIRSGGNMQ